eukprot:UN23908
MQLFPQLTQSNPEKKDSGLRGNTVVRNRCKRLSSFLSEAHKFDDHLLKLINANEVDIDAMYVCRDHKSEKKERRKKQESWLVFFSISSVHLPKLRKISYESSFNFLKPKVRPKK